MSVHELWLQYNKCANQLKDALDGSNSSVGGYAEYLAYRHYGGKILGNAHPSADIQSPDGTLYQVKARKIAATQCTQLGIIRSWDFNYLVVVLFDTQGNILHALTFPKDVANEYGREDDHQNGRVITTTQRFLGDGRAQDIKDALCDI